MNIYKKENWLIILFLNILTFGLFTFYVAKKLNVYEKEAWYSNKDFWILGFLCGIIPGIVMFFIFYIKVGCLVSKKLLVPFDTLYSYPYFWIVSLIIPVIGWTLFIIMFIYVHFWYIFYLKKGNRE